MAASERASERRGRSVVVGESRPGRVRRCGRDLGCSRGAREREVWVESRDLDASSKQVRRSARDLDATSKRVRKSARDLYVETWIDRV
ncbi:unnamed protein product [Sphagnum balticum]